MRGLNFFLSYLLGLEDIPRPNSKSTGIVPILNHIICLEGLAQWRCVKYIGRNKTIILTVSSSIDPGIVMGKKVK